MTSTYAIVAEEYGLSEQIIRQIFERVHKLNASRAFVQIDTTTFVQMAEYGAPPVKQLELSGEQLEHAIAVSISK
jgi:hypothetical protein